jgi:hypothetical protein
MTVSIWKALHQSAECVASALDMQLFFFFFFFLLLSTGRFSVNDADFTIFVPPHFSWSMPCHQEATVLLRSHFQQSKEERPHTGHCHHSPIGIAFLVCLFSLNLNWYIIHYFFFFFTCVKFRSASHFWVGDVEANVPIGRDCQIGLPHPGDADAHRRVVQGQYLLCTTIFILCVGGLVVVTLLLGLTMAITQKASPSLLLLPPSLWVFVTSILFDPQDPATLHILSGPKNTNWTSLT